MLYILLFFHDTAKFACNIAVILFITMLHPHSKPLCQHHANTFPIYHLMTVARYCHDVTDAEANMACRK